MASLFFGAFMNWNWIGWLGGCTDFVTRIGVGASAIGDWITACWTEGVARDVRKDEGFWTLMLHVLFIGNFLGTTIFDLPLSSEDLVTSLWFGYLEMGSLERKNLEGNSRPTSSSFPSLTTMNSSSISIDFCFWFPIYNKKKPKITIDNLMNWMITGIKDINLSEIRKKLQQPPKVNQTFQSKFILQFQKEMSEIQIHEMPEILRVLK